MWSILEDVVCAPEKDVHSAAAGWNVLQVCYVFVVNSVVQVHCILIDFLSGWALQCCEWSIEVSTYYGIAVFLLPYSLLTCKVSTRDEAFFSCCFQNSPLVLMVNILTAMCLGASVSWLILLGSFELLSPGCPYLFHKCLAIISLYKLSAFLSPFGKRKMEMIIYFILSHNLHRPSLLFYYYYYLHCFVPLTG